MTIFKKKATDTQETKKLPMTGKVKKGLSRWEVRLYRLQTNSLRTRNFIN